MQLWAINDAVADVLANADARNIPAEFQPSAAVARWEKSTAVIEITGVLTPTPDRMAAFFGGGNTTYPDIQAAILAAEADARVTDIQYIYDTPGGTVAGLFETIDIMKASTKPSRATVKGMAASAGYALASQAGSIEASGKASVLGSIGIVQRFFTSADVATITSRAAPNKAPDPTTEEGKAAIQDQLDAYHTLFAEAIASGRGVNVKTVNTEFGKGGTYLAGEALKRGMIDAISTTAASGPKPKGVKAMTLAELRAQHPDIFAAAVQEGVTQERERVQAHLTMAEASGAMPTAIAAINSGEGLTVKVQAEYLAAGMKRSTLGARTEETQAATTEVEGGAVTTPAATTEAPALTNAFVKAAEQLGLEVTNG